MITMAISLIAIVVAVVSVIISTNGFTFQPFVLPLPPPLLVPMLTLPPMLSRWTVYDPAYVAQQWTQDMTPAQLQQLLMELQILSVKEDHDGPAHP